VKLRFLAEALVEDEDAIEYYERAQSGLGDTFIRDVGEVLAVTLEFPEMGVPDTPPELNVRRRIVQRFGVEVDYVNVGEALIVLAVFHCKRRPGYWRDRLDRLR
jgi:plasmid stabilization system protein ParE